MSSILTSRSVLVLFFMLITTKVFGNFNLFVDKEEFHRITGGEIAFISKLSCKLEWKEFKKYQEPNF